MTVLIDAAVFPRYGRMWCHLVSDASFEELHAFAASLGMPQRAFHRDHYDVPAERRDDVLRAGAEAVTSRELVRRIVAAGLRRRAADGAGRVASRGMSHIDHLGIQCADLERSREFYTSVLAALGLRQLTRDLPVYGFGDDRPFFWIGPGGGGETRELHVAFAAADRAQVREFHRLAAEAGAEILHEPRVFPEYHPAYYGAFVRDPDGHNVEAVCHRPE